MSLTKQASCPLCYSSCKKKEIRILYLTTDDIEPVFGEYNTEKYLKELENKKEL